MMAQRPDFRAREIDRALTATVLDSAYADGQLTLLTSRSSPRHAVLDWSLPLSLAPSIALQHARVLLLCVCVSLICVCVSECL